MQTRLRQAEWWHRSCPGYGENLYNLNPDRVHLVPPDVRPALTPLPARSSLSSPLQKLTKALSDQILGLWDSLLVHGDRDPLAGYLHQAVSNFRICSKVSKAHTFACIDQ